MITLESADTSIICTRAFWKTYCEVVKAWETKSLVVITCYTTVSTVNEGFPIRVLTNTCGHVNAICDHVTGGSKEPKISPLNLSEGATEKGSEAGSTKRSAHTF